MRAKSNASPENNGNHGRGVFASRWESRLGGPKGPHAALALKERTVEIAKTLKNSLPNCAREIKCRKTAHAGRGQEVIWEISA